MNIVCASIRMSSFYYLLEYKYYWRSSYATSYE